MPSVTLDPQAAMDLIQNNQEQRRAARSAELDALEAGATPEQAVQAFATVMRGAEPAQARAYVDQAIEMLNVTPDGFMALLQAQVAREDDKVLEARNAIENSLARSRDISERMQVLQQIHQRLSQEGNGVLKMNLGMITLNGRELSMGQAVVEFDLVDELNLTDAMNRDPDNETWFVGVKLREDSVQSAIDALRQEQQTVTSSNELNMIAMQQAMQQRGQHLQLVSKVLAMMGDTERAIVGNMR